MDLIGDARIVLIGKARTAPTSSTARAEIASADRGEGLQRRRRRGGLAGRLPGEPLRARPLGMTIHPTPHCAASNGSRPGCGATPWCATSSGGCAGTTGAGRPTAAPDRLLRTGPVQPAPLDAGGHRLPRRRRPEGSRPGPGPLRLLRPFPRRRRAGLRLRGGVRRRRPASARPSSNWWNCNATRQIPSPATATAGRGRLFYAQQNATTVRNAGPNTAACSAAG